VRGTENVHHVDRLRNLLERRVGRLPENGIGLRVDDTDQAQVLGVRGQRVGDGQGFELLLGVVAAEKTGLGEDVFKADLLGRLGILTAASGFFGARGYGFVPKRSVHPKRPACFGQP